MGVTRLHSTCYNSLIQCFFINVIFSAILICVFLLWPTGCIEDDVFRIALCQEKNRGLCLL